MTDIQNDSPKVRNCTNGPQCQYYVTRKKRLCRMTVRPGHQYCGEHEPQPQTADGQDDTRIPCPNDPKHTVYVSKLEKHLSICNARATEQPVYIVPNINAPAEVDTCLRKPLSQLPWDTVMQVVDKVNFLYERHMSYYACGAWRRPALLVDRASLRHKRDNKLAGGAARIRADLAHLALDRVPLAPACRALVGLAKHLCGVATDYALRCMTGAGAASTRGLVLATCCHHRCERGAFVGNEQLEELGISGDEFNVMLGIVSWATCGDGRSRRARAEGAEAREGRLEAAARARAGRRAKRLVEWARVQWLRERGFAARLVYFVPPHVSPENVAIVATRPLQT
ncbi:tRNA:m(4)X modification enzyme TRM13 homolog isoform X2 [Helicoverpa zea]|uniref:tRNA:m(4)X modification enzyme TRM13 homolog isoform X2 n=1 Tax=Helicoverpa zea TaxID=7113 RepID=UPI001F59209D|nr:tRNA:m(4)X modification enzyme TRM13 homolog isoform X2 [Helicoverpa zea]